MSGGLDSMEAASLKPRYEGGATALKQPFAAWMVVAQDCEPRSSSHSPREWRQRKNNGAA
jgi:NADH:ubiquinone oxidoreductase subunit